MADERNHSIGAESGFDSVEASRFLQLIHGGDDRLRVFTYPDEDTNKSPVTDFEYRGTGDQALWARLQDCVRRRQAVAVSLAAFEPGTARRKQHALRLQVLGIDIDEKHGARLAPGNRGPEDVARVAIEKLTGVGLEPHFLVSSGRGLHVYLRTEALAVEDPVLRSEIETMWWKLGNLLGGATEKHDVTSVLRLPGTFNFKGGGRRPVRILTAFEKLLWKPEYPLAALRAATAALSGKPPPSRDARVHGVRSATVAAKDLTPDAARALEAALQDKDVARRHRAAQDATDDRSRAEFSYACELVRLGFSHDDICSELTRTAKGRNRGDLYRDSTSREAFSRTYGDLSSRYLRGIQLTQDVGEALSLIIEGAPRAGAREGVREVCDPLKSVLVTMTRAGDGKTQGLLDRVSLRDAHQGNHLVVAGLFTGELLRHELELNAAWPGGRIWMDGDREARLARRQPVSLDQAWSALAGVEGHHWTRERFRKTVKDPDAFAMNLGHPSFDDESLRWPEDEDGGSRPPPWLPQEPQEALRSREQWQPFAVAKFSGTPGLCIAGHDEARFRGPSSPCSTCPFTSCRANTNTAVTGKPVGAKTLWKAAPVKLMTHSGLWTQEVFASGSQDVRALVLDEVPDQVFRLAELSIRCGSGRRGQWNLGHLDVVIDFLTEVALSKPRRDKEEVCRELLKKLGAHRLRLQKLASKWRKERIATGDIEPYLRADQIAPMLTRAEFRRVLEWHRTMRPDIEDEDDLLGDRVGEALRALNDFCSDEPHLDVIQGHKLGAKHDFGFRVLRPVNGWKEFVTRPNGEPRRVLILDATAGVDPRYLPLHGITDEQYPTASYPNTTLVLTARSRSLETFRAELRKNPDAIVETIANQFRPHAASLRRLVRIEERNGRRVRKLAPPRLLIVTAKRLKERLREALRRSHEAGHFPWRIKVVHFGALRGRNDLANYDAVYFTHLYRRPELLYVGLASLLLGFDDLPKEWRAEEELRKGRGRHQHWELAELLRRRWMTCDLYQDAMRIAVRQEPDKPTAIFIPTTDPYFVTRILRFFPAASVVDSGKVISRPGKMKPKASAAAEPAPGAAPPDPAPEAEVVTIPNPWATGPVIVDAPAPGTEPSPADDAVRKVRRWLSSFFADEVRAGLNGKRPLRADLGRDGWSWAQQVPEDEIKAAIKAHAGEKDAGEFEYFDVAKALYSRLRAAWA